ncbi:MAG: cell division protein FtsA [Candidatus Taylorbacteria bacterium]|nr:cell division protein FtsA [Candidatus Taylorbacteria bacterium]
MSRPIITGIDIGTYHVKVVIAHPATKSSSAPVIIGTGVSESRGIRHGYITSVHDIGRSIRAALDEAERKAKVKVKRAFISIGGIGLGSITSQGATIVTRADNEITQLDVKKAHEQSEHDIQASAILNRKIIHSVPLEYKIDGKKVLGKPEGMKAQRLEVKMLFITCLEHHLNDLIQAVEEAGVEVEDVMASPLAASLVTLTKSQKIAGCVLANIGAETVSIAVFENNIPISLEVFPIGSTDITNDIALGLKVPLEEAEQIKIGAITGTSYPRKKLEEIIYARLSDIFDLIEAHLKKIGRSGLLPAGIIITGGGAGLGSIEDMAKISLRLPSRIGSVMSSQDSRESFKDATWAVAYGLCLFGISADEGPSLDSGARLVRTTKNNIIAWLKQFLP